jgi:hypothetical protein
MEGVTIEHRIYVHVVEKQNCMDVKMLHLIGRFPVPAGNRK